MGKIAIGCRGETAKREGGISENTADFVRKKLMKKESISENEN